MEEIVTGLNDFQPAMLGGYPTALELLFDEQRSGRLKIEPVIIMTGGEYLSDELRQQLAETFNCYVQTNYSCTEGGTVACECREGHIHINEDWVIVEAKLVLLSYLNEHGIEVDIYLSQEELQVHPQSGKFKHIYRA